MTTKFTQHWAVCDPDGSVVYENRTRAHIYWSRDLARAALADIEKERGQKMHVDAVQVEEFEAADE